MATVFMKWLETTPGSYDRGIRLLTLNKLRFIKEQIASDIVHHDDRVLEIGCGTGTLAVLMARRGAQVTAVDASPWMLAEARRKVAAEALDDRVTLLEMDASMLTDHLAPASFDVIVGTLVFSELTDVERRFVLDESRALLAPGGRLIIADEVIPEGLLRRLLYYLVRLPLALITWLLTRAKTHPLRRLPQELAAAGFWTETSDLYLVGSLELLVARSAAEVEAVQVLGFPRLRHRVTWRTLLADLWCLFFRIIPPYPKVRPGLYRIGDPDRDAPVLVTGNFDLTVRRVVKAIDGQLDAWLLVAHSAGINVWCAAGGGYFTAEKVIAAVKTSGLTEVVDHRALILPQLAANGVDGWKIRKETGWGVHWGPARAEDISTYLDNRRKKTDGMRWVTFPLKDRLEMVTVSLGFYGLLILLPVAIFWRDLFWPVTASLIGLSYFYAAVHPWLPGRDGLLKSMPLTLIALAGLLVYTLLGNPLPVSLLFNRVVGLTGLAVFTAAELQGMSPLMRGEQANWGWEVLIGAVLGLTYWLVPLALGWR
jgi:ubiquinone/menaquinone biosynthesis C-methylase UbiE